MKMYYMYNLILVFYNLYNFSHKNKIDKTIIYQTNYLKHAF